MAEQEEEPNADEVAGEERAVMLDENLGQVVEKAESESIGDKLDRIESKLDQLLARP